jgi:hypothetical protein
MRTIFNSRERARLIDRLARLRPSSRPRWGTMNAHQMVCHLNDALESSFHESTTVGRGWLARFPLKQLAIYVLPWPKGKLQSPPELLVSNPTEWSKDLELFRHRLERVAARGPSAEWPASDVFGRLSGRDWGALLRTHIDHHLRQFGA